jgi:hypothetical protein
MLRRLALAWCVLILPALACSAVEQVTPDTNAQFIQGQWSYSEDLGGGFASVLTWNFRAGHFTLEGYPPLFQEGDYRVVKSEGDTVILRLVNQSGDLSTDDRDIEIILDRSAETLMIDGQGPFHRVNP